MCGFQCGFEYLYYFYGVFENGKIPYGKPKEDEG
jgi:hypothetical protein